MKQLGRSIRRSFWLAIVLVVAAAGAGSGKAAEPIKIGLLNLPNGGPVFIAEERGYFAPRGSIRRSFISKADSRSPSRRPATPSISASPG